MATNTLESLIMMMIQSTYEGSVKFEKDLSVIKQ